MSAPACCSFSAPPSAQNVRFHGGLFWGHIIVFVSFLFFPLSHVIIGVKKTDTCSVHHLDPLSTWPSLSALLLPGGSHPPHHTSSFVFTLYHCPYSQMELGQSYFTVDYKLPWNTTWVLAFTYASSQELVNNFSFTFRECFSLGIWGEDSGLSLIHPFRVFWKGRGIGYQGPSHLPPSPAEAPIFTELK